MPRFFKRPSVPPSVSSLGWQYQLAYWAERYGFTLAVTASVIALAVLLWWFPSPTAEAEQQGVGLQVTQPILADDPLKGEAELYVFSSPRGALVVIEGDTLGRTPLLGHRLPAGAHHITLSAEGYEASDQLLIARSDRLNSLDVKLEETTPAAAPRSASQAAQGNGVDRQEQVRRGSARFRALQLNANPCEETEKCLEELRKQTQQLSDQKVEPPKRVGW